MATKFMLIFGVYAFSNLTQVRALFTLSYTGSDLLCSSVNRGPTSVRLRLFSSQGSLLGLACSDKRPWFLVSCIDCIIQFKHQRVFIVPRESVIKQGLSITNLIKIRSFDPLPQIATKDLTKTLFSHERIYPIRSLRLGITLRSCMIDLSPDLTIFGGFVRFFGADQKI